MSALRWVAGPYGCTDLLDEDDRLRGYVMPITTGVRGYAIRLQPNGLAALDGMEDRPTVEAAQAWIESRVGAEARTMGRDR